LLAFGPLSSVIRLPMSLNNLSLDINEIEGRLLLELIETELQKFGPAKGFAQVIPPDKMPTIAPKKPATSRADIQQLLRSLHAKLEQALSGQSQSGVFPPKV
jgi:hypothetical protein